MDLALNVIKSEYLAYKGEWWSAVFSQEPCKSYAMRWIASIYFAIVGISYPLEIFPGDADIAAVS